MGVFNLVDNSVQQVEAKNNKQVVEDTLSNNVSEPSNGKEDNKEEGPKIVLDGPLSHIYTQALNAVYANEDVAAMIAYGMDQQNKEEENKADVYVYCLDTSCMNTSEIVEAIDKVATLVKEDKYKEVMVAAECSGNINSNIDLVKRYGQDIGVKVLVTRKSALESVMTCLESYKV